jgi:AGZA family xanthine/uracil permease-like MFS transporter
VATISTSSKGSPSVLERWFGLAENGTTARREVLAGVTTFLTMAYIIFVQPAMLSGKLGNQETGMDFGAVAAATCIASALATVVMALYARYPIALAPGMGMNSFFVATVFVAAKQFGADNGWRVALGVVFVSGVLFLIITLTRLREVLFNAVSPSLKNGIAVGIGLFIAFLGLQKGGLIVSDTVTGVKLTAHVASPDMVIFFVGLLLTAILYVRKVRGAILWGIAATTLLAISLKLVLPLFSETGFYAKFLAGSKFQEQFQIAHGVFSTPPSLAPTFLQMDVVSALKWQMLPFVVIFLMMIVFDTMGTLIGVGEQAGFIRDNKLPRVEKAMLADASGIVAGACLGTSTVTAYIESAAGVEQGGRTGLTALTVAALFLAALFFSPIIEMVGNYPPLAAPALVVVGCMMMRNVTKIDWSDYSEALPAFLTIIGIPLTYSIADGVALGLISYPVLKLAGRRGKEVHPALYVLAGLLLLYFLALR